MKQLVKLSRDHCYTQTEKVIYEFSMCGSMCMVAKMYIYGEWNSNKLGPIYTTEIN